MNLIIAGSRSFTDYGRLEKEVLSFLKEHKAKNEKVSIISGRAKGADTLGEKFADKFGLEKILMPAEWEKYGKAAGHIRNRVMRGMATHCMVFWDGKSPGSKNMIDITSEVKSVKLKVVEI